MLIVEYTDESGKEIIKDLNEIVIKKIIELIDDKSDIKITNIASEEQSEEIEKLEDNVVNLECQLEGRDAEVIEKLKRKIDKLEKEVEEKDDLIDELEDASLSY